uniref:Transposase (Putative), gypsy type n=1 Tax=Tanacetum cinerariifolium TaxID=118510 RepID=A0A6L2KSN7_TANCI|nr:hypothetical protein [Tanacetum cinerariifolium]
MVQKKVEIMMQTAVKITAGYIVRLKFRYLSVLPSSSVVTYASVTLPCMEMDLISFIRTANPTKVRIGERKYDKDKPKLLETIVGRVVLLLPVAPGRSSGELEASVEKIFGEGGSGEQAKQGDSTSGGHGVGIDVVAETSVEDVAPTQLKRQKKRKTKVDDAGEPSHPVKKLRDDYEALGGPTVGGKSQSLIQRLLARAMQNAEVKSGAMPTLPFVSSPVSTTPEREGGDHTELLAGANLPTIGASQRFVISLDSSDHSGVNIAEAEVDSVVRTSMPIITSATTTTPTADHAVIAKEKLVGSSVFVYVPQWNVTNGFCLDDGGSYREMVDEFAPPKFSAYVRGIDHDQLFTKFNVGAARQIFLSAEVRMRAEYHIKEKRMLKAIVEEKDQAVEKSLLDEVIVLNERNTILEKKRNALDVKVTDLQAVVVSKDRELTNSAAQLTSIKSHNDNLTDQALLAILIIAVGCFDDHTDCPRGNPWISLNVLS